MCSSRSWMSAQVELLRRESRACVENGGRWIEFVVLGLG